MEAHTPGGSRSLLLRSSTHNLWFLRPAPLPVGLQEHHSPARIRTRTLRFQRARCCQLHHRGSQDAEAGVVRAAPPEEVPASLRFRVAATFQVVHSAMVGSPGRGRCLLLKSSTCTPLPNRKLQGYVPSPPGQCRTDDLLCFTQALCQSELPGDNGESGIRTHGGQNAALR